MPALNDSKFIGETARIELSTVYQLSLSTAIFGADRTVDTVAVLI